MAIRSVEYVFIILCKCASFLEVHHTLNCIQALKLLLFRMIIWQCLSSLYELEWVRKTFGVKSTGDEDFLMSEGREISICGIYFKCIQLDSVAFSDVSAYVHAWDKKKLLIYSSQYGSFFYQHPCMYMKSDELFFNWSF